MSRGYIRNLIGFYEEKNERKRQRTEVRDLAYAFHLPRNEFMNIYKVSPEMVQYLCGELNEELSPRTSEGLPVYVKVLTGLRILIDGHYQRGNGQDENTSIAPTTVSKYFRQFLEAVNSRLKPVWIVFPGTAEGRQIVANGFQQKFGLPNILGAIDCTHITLFPPSGVESVQFKNRHLATSINVQLVCDADCRIINVNANYPGRVHDQFIFNNSVVKDELIHLYNNRMGDYHLLGDSGYALEPWLMTPVREAPEGSPEARYTKWHCQTRNTIERTNGYLKGTFRMLGLDRNIHYMPEKAPGMIYAACTLYNIMKHFRMPMETLLETTAAETTAAETMQPSNHNQRFYRIAFNKRNDIVNTYFR